MTEQERQAATGGYHHVEAYCLMEYASDDGREVEYLWNSRDGVTPFIISSRHGTELRHANWGRDRRLPDFRPQPGSRIFVDMTSERAREKAEQLIVRHWDDPLSGMAAVYHDKQKALELLMQDMLRPGAPDIMVVKEQHAAMREIGDGMSASLVALIGLPVQPVAGGGYACRVCHAWCATAEDYEHDTNCIADGAAYWVKRWTESEDSPHG